MRGGMEGIAKVVRWDVEAGNADVFLRRKPGVYFVGLLAQLKLRPFTHLRTPGATLYVQLERP